MKYLLDTNVVSKLFDKAARWLREQLWCKICSIRSDSQRRP